MKAFIFLINLVLLSIIECKNFYDILGVSKTDSTSQIKKAFRSLAMKYHPDKNPDKNAEAKFREIVEAYEVLSDPDKRKAYDQTGGTNFNNQNFDNNNSNFNYQDFFREFDEAMKNHHRQHHEAHNRAHREHMRSHHEHFKNHGFMFDFEDLFNDDMDLFGGAFGGAFGGGFDSIMGESFVQEINLNQNGRNCRTIKKTQGNTVITHTECH